MYCPQLTQTQTLTRSSLLVVTGLAFVLCGRTWAGDVPANVPANFAWSQTFEGSASLFAPVVGPDGTIYTSNGGAVTAISLEGEVLWSVPTDTSLAPVSIGSDGTIYAAVGAVGANDIILALNPDGTEKWTFDAGDSIHAGPNVGPDGSIYAIADALFGGLGIFSLSPDGAMQWSNQGEPILSADTGQPHEIIFGDDRAYVTMATQGAGGGGGQPAGMWAFDFDGNQAFTLMESCQGQPVINPLTGELVTGNGICQSVDTHDAQTGALLWSEDAPSVSPCSGMANIAIGPDGSIYTAFCYRAFWSLTSDGDQRWFDDDFDFYFQMDRFGVAPDNSIVLDLGGDIGEPGWVRAFSTQDSSLQWQLNLDLSNQKASSRPTFDMSHNRVYFNVNRFGSDQSDLFAVDLVQESGIASDLDGDGVVGAADLAMLLGAWGPCRNTCPADLDGNGFINASDLAILLGSWG